MPNPKISKCCKDKATHIKYLNWCGMKYVCDKCGDWCEVEEPKPFKYPDTYQIGKVEEPTQGDEIENKPPIEPISKCCHATVSYEPNPFCDKCNKLCDTIDSMPVTVGGVKLRIPFDEEPTQGEEFDWKYIIKKCGEQFGYYGEVMEFIKTHCVPRKAWEKLNAEHKLLKVKSEVDYLDFVELDRKLAAANQEIALLKKKLEDIADYAKSLELVDKYFLVARRLQFFLTPSPKEEKK